MALAEVQAGGGSAQRTWHWRGELALALATLRSSYPYILAVLAAALITLAYQVGDTVGVRVGGGFDAPYVLNFQEREAADGLKFRWASDRSRVLLAGTGATESTLTITAGPRPDGVAEPVQVIVNGIDVGRFTPRPGQAAYSFPLPANTFSYGDLTVDLLSKAQIIAGKGGNQVPFGPQVTDVRVVANDSNAFVKPSRLTLASWFLIAPLLYFLVRRLGMRELGAAGAALLVLLLGAWATTVERLDFAILAPRLVVMLVFVYILVLVTDLVIPRLMAAAGVTIAPAVWRTLQFIFLTSLSLKLAGIIHPQLFFIDLPWHGAQFEKVLNGRFFEIYRPGAEGISTLPYCGGSKATGCWHVEGQFPYSPFTFLFGLPLYLGPFGRELSINIWSALFDCSRILMVFYLARRFGVSVRGALLAAFVMSMTASTFLLHSWANYPTTYSQWCAIFFITLLVARFQSLRRPWVFAGLLALLTVTMLLYVGTAVFIGLFMVYFLASIAWRGGPDERRQLMPLSLLLVGGSFLAFVLYYMQFVIPMITQTLPGFADNLGRGEALGYLGDPVPVYVAKYLGRLFYYGILISLLLAPFGLWTLLRNTRDRLIAPVFMAWFGVFITFFISGYRIDMTDKEIWFVVPAAAICAGIACDVLLTKLQARIADRWQATKDTPGATPGWWRASVGRLSQVSLGTALVAIYCFHLTWASITLWIYRIMVTKH